MFTDRSRFLILLATLLCAAAVSAQQIIPRSQAGNTRIDLDVVVAPKSGPAVGDLQQQDFTILDNKAPQTITSFKAVPGREAPIEVILVVDAVNTGAQTVSYAREQIDKFLRLDSGHLAYPTALAVFTEQGVQVVGNFSGDGNALSAALQQNNIGLRAVGRSAGYYGDAQRWQLSIGALNQLVASVGPRPGRKIFLWVSPGWPLLSGPNTELDSKQEQQIFASIVSFSTQLRRARVTLCSVDPLGMNDMARTTYYKEFLKGVNKPTQVNVGDLALPVLAIQSGGLALNSTNDIARMLQQCVADAAPYYEISFDAPPAEKPNEYHQLEVKIAKPGLTARTRQGYYAQPASHQ